MNYLEQQAEWNAFISELVGKGALLLLAFFFLSVLLHNKRFIRALIISLFFLPFVVLEVVDLIRR